MQFAMPMIGCSPTDGIISWGSQMIPDFLVSDASGLFGLIFGEANSKGDDKERMTLMAARQLRIFQMHIRREERKDLFVLGIFAAVPKKRDSNGMEVNVYLFALSDDNVSNGSWFESRFTQFLRIDPEVWMFESTLHQEGPQSGVGEGHVPLRKFPSPVSASCDDEVLGGHQAGSIVG